MKRKYAIGLVLSICMGGFAFGGQLLSIWPFSAPSLSDHTKISPANNGDIVYDSTDNRFYGRSNGAWISFASATGGSTLDVFTPTTASYNITPANDVVLVNSGTTNALNLSLGGSSLGKVIIVKKTDATFTSITINSASGDTIQGSTSTTIDTKGETLNLVAKSSGWEILNRYVPSEWNYYDISAAGMTSGFGTVDTTGVYEAYWRRVGSNIEIRGKFKAGTVAATAAQVFFPGNLSSPNTSVIPTDEIVNGGGYRLEAVSGAGTTKIFNVIVGPNLSYIRFGNVSNDISSSPLTALNGANMINNAANFAFSASAPIANWNK